MENNRESRMFVIMCDTPWDWTGDYVRKTAEQLSQRGKVFCFFWTEVMSLKEYFISRKKVALVRRVSADIMLYQAVHFVPFIRFKWIVKLNRLFNLAIFRWLIFLNTGFNKYKKTLWIFHPNFGEIVKYFSGYKIVYDSLDYFAGTVAGTKKGELEAAEKIVLKRADVVTANSHFLQKRLLISRPDTMLVLQGFQVLAGETINEEFKKPVVGYVGGINFRLDFKLLYQLAKRHPRWQFAMCGPIQPGFTEHPGSEMSMQKLRSLKNVFWREYPRNKLASVIGQFDAAIIPYRMDQAFNKYCYPMKVFEYLYSGRPIVSADIDEFGYPPFTNGLVQIAKTLQEWEEKISVALKTSLTKSQVAARQKFALDNSWDNKLTQILDRLFVLEN